MANSPSAQQQIAYHMRINALLERGARRDFRAEINRRIRNAAKAYKQSGVLGAEMALNGHADAMIALIKKHYQRAIDAHGPRVIEMLKGEGAYASKDYAEDIFSQMIQLFLNDSRTSMLGNNIANTTVTQIRSIIAQGISDGLGATAIARSMTQQLGGVMSATRAHVIARTEIHNAASAASDVAARSTGIPELQKEWVSVQDARTRGAKANADHFAQDGTVVGMDDPFTFTTATGDTYILMRPGDPSGPAKGTINCRCVLAYVPPE
jgi:uncharacterized protein with gpF-like domain